jgi:hypothetical protein
VVDIPLARFDRRMRAQLDVVRPGQESPVDEDLPASADLQRRVIVGRAAILGVRDGGAKCSQGNDLFSSSQICDPSMISCSLEPLRGVQS